MKGKYIITLDQGTTSSRAIVFDGEANVVGSLKREFSQIYPKPGWVEHDPWEIKTKIINDFRKKVYNIEN